MWPILRDKGPAALRDRLRVKGELLRLPETWKTCIGAQSAWAFRVKVTRVLYTTLGFTVIDMAACFVALPLTPQIACSGYTGGGVLSFTVGLGTICLSLYVRPN